MKYLSRALCVLMIIVLVICSCGSIAFAAKSVAVKSVKLKSASYSMNVNTCIKLTASVSPSNATNKKITWSSSNTKIAKVDKNGVVSGIKDGTVTITAKSSNGKKATCKVVVKSIPVKKVSFAKSTYDIVGKTQLYATITPSSATNHNLSWSSSNTKVATVDSKGVVTPKGYGTATITAKSNNGKTATCKVSVKKDQKITKTYTVAKSGPYKLEDTMVIVVDGKTGKIRSHDCYQTKTDLTIIIGAVVSKNGIKAYSVRDDYIDFRASWSIAFSIGVSNLNVNTGDMVSRTNSYRLYKDGTLKLLDGTCTDWLGLCKKK